MALMRFSLTLLSCFCLVACSSISRFESYRPYPQKYLNDKRVGPDPWYKTQRAYGTHESVFSDGTSVGVSVVPSKHEEELWIGIIFVPFFPAFLVNKRSQFDRNQKLKIEVWIYSQGQPAKKYTFPQKLKIIADGTVIESQTTENVLGTTYVFDKLLKDVEKIEIEKLTIIADSKYELQPIKFQWEQSLNYEPLLPMAP